VQNNTESEIIADSDEIEGEPQVDDEMQENDCTGAESEEKEIFLDLENDLIDFLKKREDIEIDDLLEEIHMEKKLDDNGIDGTNFEDNDEFDEEKEEDMDEVCDDSPIYPGHFLSVRTSVLLIWLFAITHSLNSEQMSDLLTLISLHMMSSYSSMKSFYRFKQYFKNLKSPLIKHFYCSFCYTPVLEKADKCPNTVCQRNVKESSSKEYFIEMPIISQLSGLFSREDFKQGLKYRKERIKKCKDNIEDVYDSEQYKLLSDNGGPLSSENENNISFIFHTDGIPVFKSSKTSMWPIFLMVNELPYKMRKNRENIILCGLWFGQNKPLMNLFCGPLHESLQKLQNGVTVKLQNNEDIKVHGYLFCVTCDTPARNSVLNLNQHTGGYCCPKCLQSGINFRTNKGGNIRIFPYQIDNPAGPERNLIEMKLDAQEAVDRSITKHGVKGPSFLMFCPVFDPVKNMGIDYMHLLFLGTVRLLLNLWFNVSHSLQSFSIYKFVEIVDSRLTSIKPSHFVTRKPRNISGHLKFWKAAELRSWFFYYSIPCIMDLMQPKHFYHYCALVEAIFLLNQSSISENDIQNSERLLKYFVFMMPGLYGERYMTINVHSLLHLPQMVKALGPLWTLSCFPFESASGDLLKLFHGTQYIDIQIINAVHVFHTLPSLAQTISKTSLAYPLLKSMLKSGTRQTSPFQLYGRGYERIITRSVQGLICQFFLKSVDSKEILFYKRAFIRGIMYHSSDYTRAYSRNSYTVKFVYNDTLQFGQIIWFGKLKNELEEEVNVATSINKSQFACISLFKVQEIDVFCLNHEKVIPDEHIKSNFMQLRLRHISFVKHTDKVCIVPMQNITDLCLYIKCDNYIAVCKEPNHNEVNL